MLLHLGIAKNDKACCCNTLTLTEILDLLIYYNCQLKLTLKMTLATMPDTHYCFNYSLDSQIYGWFFQDTRIMITLMRHLNKKQCDSKWKWRLVKNIWTLPSTLHSLYHKIASILEWQLTCSLKIHSWKPLMPNCKFFSVNIHHSCFWKQMSNGIYVIGRRQTFWR